MEKIEKVRKRIRLARLDKGYSQGYIADQLNISQIAYHKIESGKTQLKVETLIKLAFILEITESFIF